MIDVSNTILSSFNKYLTNLQKYARNDTKLLKQIFILTILNDITEWAAYKDISQKRQAKLKQIKDNWIVEHSNLIKEYISNCIYTNVNTPQANAFWKVPNESINIENQLQYIDLCGCAKIIDGELIIQNENG